MLGDHRRLSQPWPPYWTIMKFIFWISVIIILALICCQSDGLTVSSSYHPIFQGTRLKCGEICSKVAFHIFTLVCFNKRINITIVKVSWFYVLWVSSGVICFFLSQCEQKCTQCHLRTSTVLSHSDRGPLKYYVIKEVGGWGQKMAIFDDLQHCKSSKRRVSGSKKVKNMMT